MVICYVCKERSVWSIILGHKKSIPVYLWLTNHRVCFSNIMAYQYILDISSVHSNFHDTVIIPLSITCWNVRVLNSSILYRRHLMHNNEIIPIGKHWLHANILNK